jgi:capsular polysaccharide biosynthesis protein
MNDLPKRRPRLAEPERSVNRGIVDVLKRDPKIVIAPVVLLCLLALVAGFLRPANYTAAARLSVGRIDVATTAAPGVVSASQSLASAYSRAISADQVAKTIEAKIGTGFGTITASPIPESPVILVEGESTSEAKAVLLANTASRALIKYIDELNNSSSETESLLRRYEEVQAEIPELSPGPKLSAAELKKESLESAYRSNLSEETSGNDLRVLTTARGAESDRKSVVLVLLVAAVIAGCGIGVLIAYLRTRKAR